MVSKWTANCYVLTLSQSLESLISFSPFSIDVTKFFQDLLTIIVTLWQAVVLVGVARHR